MKPLPTLRGIALAALIAFALAPAAHAEDGEGGGNDLKKKIQQKMEKILQLMRDNEKALLELSTGAAAETRKVDVEIPPGTPKGGKAGGSDAGSEGGAKGSKSDGAAQGEDAANKDAAKELEKLLESLSQKGGVIPDEIKQLIEMIPL